MLKFEKGTPINEWIVTGPFDSKLEAPIIDEDFLRPLGITEDQDMDICSLRNAMETTLLLRQKAVRVSDGLVDLQHVFGREHMDLTAIRQSGAYLDCIIESDIDQDAYLSLGNATAMKIWLRGSIIYKSDQLSGVETYCDSVRITLKAGRNTLRAKVVIIDYGRGIAAHLEKDADAAARVVMEEMRIRPPNLLKEIFLPSKRRLTMSLRGVPKEFSCRASILDLNETPLLELSPKETRGWVPTLSEGMYIFRIVVAGKNYDQPFCVGEREKIFAQIKEEAAAFLDETPRGLSLAGNIRRLEILFDPKVKPERFSYSWDRKIMFALANIARILRQSARADTQARVSGLQIRGFKSKIDDKIQFYRLYIPENTGGSGAPIPLVVIVPTVVSANREFIASPFMASQNDAERVADIAERHRMAVVWCGYRNQPRGIPAELAHVDEVLADVGTLYSIDSTRIFLSGACSGGAISSFYVLDRPGRYAGIALLNPVFAFHWGVNAHWNFAKFASFSEYETECELAPALLTKTRIPMLLINDGAEPGHGELAISQAFAESARKNQYPLEFELHARPRMQHFDAWERFFAWFAVAKGASAPADLPSFWRADTIMAGLARRFVIVEGTGGTRDDAQIIQGISTHFQNVWKETHHGLCRVVRDIDFKPETDTSSTIILIGNKKTNSVWRAMEPDYPITLGTKRIRLMNREWSGDGLSVVASIKNPTGKGSVIFCGAADLDDAKFGGMDIGTEGWFSFAIFGKVAGTRELLDVGRWPKPAP